jgi:hypothetical protein
MPRKTDDEKYEIVLRAFQEAGKYYFANAKSKRQKAALFGLLKESLRTFTISAKEHSKVQGCPPGKVLCADGSCMPEGMCKTGLK